MKYHDLPPEYQERVLRNMRIYFPEALIEARIKFAEGNLNQMILFSAAYEDEFFWAICTIAPRVELLPPFPKDERTIEEILSNPEVQKLKQIGDLFQKAYDVVPEDVRSSIIEMASNSRPNTAPSQNRLKNSAERNTATLHTGSVADFLK